MANYADTSAYTEGEKELWVKLAEKQGKTYYTAKGLPFTYVIKGNEIFFSRKKKSVTRATVNQAYRKMCEEEVTCSKRLVVFGRSYLYPVFKDIGL